MTRPTTLSIFILTGLVMLSFVTYAQPTGGGPGGGGPPVPISGIEVLIGLGGIWGARKVYQAGKSIGRFKK